MIIRGIPSRLVTCSRVLIRFNLSKQNIHFHEENLVKNKNNFNDQLNAVVNGRQPFGQMGLLQSEELRKIIDTSNFAEKEMELLKENVEEAKVKDEKTSEHHNSVEDKYTDGVNENEKDAGLGIPDLPSATENKRSDFAKKMEKYLDSLQDTIFTASRTLNDVTGYSSIEKLKHSIETLESQLKAARELVKTNKEIYSSAIASRSKLQKEVNELLTRKHNWSAEDLERFTNLYRNDHVNEQREVSAQDNLDKCERTVDSIQLKLTQLILARYHEEQIWSDKIRRASTYGTWGIMGLNLLLFIVATFLVEPWKRRKLVGAFEEKVKTMLFETSEQQTGRIDEMIKKKDGAMINSELSTPSSSYSSFSSNSASSGLKSWLFKDEPTAANDVFTVPLPKDSNNETMVEYIKSTYTQFIAPETKYVQFDKSDFNIVLTSSLAIGIAIGSTLSYLLR